VPLKGILPGVNILLLNELREVASMSPFPVNLLVPREYGSCPECILPALAALSRPFSSVNRVAE